MADAPDDRRLRRAYGVLRAALELSSGKREAFIAGACGTDGPLECMVRKLLSDVPREGSFRKSARGTREE